MIFLFSPSEIDSVIWGSDNQGFNKTGGLQNIKIMIFFMSMVITIREYTLSPI